MPRTPSFTAHPVVGAGGGVRLELPAAVLPARMHDALAMLALGLAVVGLGGSAATTTRLVTKSTEFKSDLKSKSKFCLSQSFPPDLAT